MMDPTDSSGTDSTGPIDLGGALAGIGAGVTSALNLWSNALQTQANITQTRANSQIAQGAINTSLVQAQAGQTIAQLQAQNAVNNAQAAGGGFAAMVANPNNDRVMLYLTLAGLVLAFLQYTHR